MTHETSQPAAAVEGLDDYFWDDLLAYIEEKRVIPIIGPDLISVEVEGQETLLYRWLAQRLAPRLSVPVQALPAEFSLNEVICEFLSRRGRREDVYPRLRMIMRDTSFSPSEALRQLAAITDFNLYVATTFDSLLEQAINEVRFNGKTRTEVLSYAPNKLVDLRCEKDRLEYPTVYHLLGKLAAAPSYAICDEDILEFICTLQSENFCPETLFSELENNNLLILGCGFSDWLERFFLRMAKRHRLSDPRDVLEVVADSHTPRDPNLVVFLQHVSSRTKVFRGGDASAFIGELWRRWQARQPAITAGGVSRPQPLRFLPPEREMPEGAVFISYAREDLGAVQELKAGLDAAGLTVWFDMERLGSGDDFDRKIQRNISRCSFFLPVISANTQRREEGYFRREWHYAADRDKNIAEGAYFIIPVAIDETPSEDARVPECFRPKLWTRLPGGRVNPDFAQRMRQLTGKEGS
jgi:hypothetical protein